MQGLHLTADLRGCPLPQPLMVDAAALRGFCLQAVQDAGLRTVGELFHRFAAPGNTAGGVTGMVLLAESHLAVHTWPELAAVTLDVYVCNMRGDHSAGAEALLAALEAPFAATTCQRHRVRRGAALTPAPPPAKTPGPAVRGAGARIGSAR